MKDYSAAQIKRGFKTAIQQVPRSGTRVRELFDLFIMYKGQIIQLDYKVEKNRCNLSTYIVYLKTFYGLDIVYVGKHRWRLIGEWIGAKYVSYEADKPVVIKLKKKDL